MKLFSAGVVLSVLAASGCGPGATAQATRPKDPTAAATLDAGGTCHDTDGDAEPLVVDWKPEDRGDLEVAMKEGLAVVNYSCKGMKLLKSCRLDGTYGFIGMTTKEQVIRLTNADEIKVNLPLGGVGIAGSVGAELGRGATIDIGLMMIGKKRTTWTKAAKPDLQGSCEGATHFVRGATIGAFAMGTGTSSKQRAVAEVFGASASGAASSEKETMNKDGSMAACAAATPDADKAPAQCGAPIRLVLAPIAASKGAEATSASDSACPKGLVWENGKCAAPKADIAHLCKSGDLKDCTAQCDKGNLGSCSNLGNIFASEGVKGQPRAVELFKKACDGGESRGCVNFANMMQVGAGGLAKNPEQAVKLQQKACTDGEPVGCASLADSYVSGRGVGIDKPKALGLFSRACDGGIGYGCYQVGLSYRKGDSGLTADPAKAAAFMKRGCDAGNMPEACKK